MKQNVGRNGNEMTQYLKRLISWITKGKYLYISVTTIILVFHIDKIDLGIRTIDLIRYCGLLLQLIGTITLISSLKDRLFHFKNDNITDFLLNYFKEFPFKKRTQHHMVAGTGVLAALTSEARLTKNL